MKKLFYVLIILFLAMPLFSATISVKRYKPAELNLSPARTVAILPVELYPRKYTAEQEAIGKTFFSEIGRYIQDDDYFTLVDSESAEIGLRLVFEDFNVSDNGITISSKGDDGKEIVTKDEWERTVSSNMKFYVLNNKDKTVISQKDYKIFDLSSKTKKALLPKPEAVAFHQLKGFIVNAGMHVFNCVYYLPVALLDSKIKENKNSMKEAQKLAKKENYSDALNIYKDLYEKTSDFAAGFNYARMMQVLKDFDESEKLLLNLMSVNPKEKKVKQALDSLEKDRSEIETLKNRYN